MIDEINSEIKKLENQPASYQTIERLACLYIVRDHLTEPPVTGSDVPQGESDFYCACSGKSISEVMEVIDELMNVLAVLQPRIYSAVISKLS